MRNILLSLILLFNGVNVENEVSEVEKIQYLTSDYDEGRAKLDIKIRSKIKDCIQLNIFFYDKEKQLLNNKYYSSSLVIDGIKNTSAKIPIDMDDKIYLNIVLYSGVMEKEILNIMFPLYPKESGSCNLSVQKTCISKWPNLIVYEYKHIEEKYESVALVNEKLDFNVFDNAVPINRIRLKNSINLKEGSAFLILKEKVKQFDIDYNGRYVFPLDVKKEKGLFTFDFVENYYVDELNGKTSQNYLKNGVLKKKILLPYIDEEYTFIIEIKDAFISFDSVTLNFKVSTYGKLIGECSKAKYCFRRSYL